MKNPPPPHLFYLGFKWLKATEPLRGDHFTQFPGVSGTRLTDLGRMED